MGASTLGRVSARAVRPRHADKLYERLQEESGHSTAHYTCRVARRVWKWAARRELVDAHPNPWAGMELASVPKRHQRWTAQQVLDVRRAAVEAGRPSVGLAVHIAYCFTHRQGDVLALTWSALDAERERQREAAIASTHVVVCETTRRPWLGDHFRHVFREVANKAGLPSALQFRDLRATGLTEMADAEVSIMDMSTHSTHATIEMARRYSRKTAEQFQRAAAKRLARQKQPGNG